MNSWNALEEIADELKYVCNDGINLAKYDERRILAIQKDLMILNILRKHIELVELVGDEGTYNTIRLYINELNPKTTHDFDEVVEWLERE